MDTIDGWHPTNRFNPATCMCLSWARTWMDNATLRGLFVFSEFI